MSDTVYLHDDSVSLVNADCLETMRSMPDNCIDAIVTDGPYGLEFMGKAWDDFTNYASITEGTGSPHARNHSVSFAGSPNPTCRKCGGLRSLKTEGSGGRTKCRCEQPEFPNHRTPAMQKLQQFYFDWAVEALRILKPGGHVLAFGGSRTYHRIAAGIEDAGFEIRDSILTIHWIYATGFPKSVDLAKAIDKAEGHWRGRAGAQLDSGTRALGAHYERTDKGEPVTPLAKAFEGWGTALKPSHEPIILARKPLIGTLVENILAHGTGGINIDESRVGNEVRVNPPAGNKAGGSSLNMSVVGMPQDAQPTIAEGRFPPNVLLVHTDGCFDTDCADDCPIAELDRQSGVSKTPNTTTRGVGGKNGRYGPVGVGPVNQPSYGDMGGASRFFPTFRYTPKPSRKEREAGLTDLPTFGAEDTVDRDPESAGAKNPRAGAGRGAGAPTQVCTKCEKNVDGGRAAQPCEAGGAHEIVDGPARPGVMNVHPTVKPIALMEWLVTLVTPTGGVVLDTFMGSGTTGIAAVRKGFQFIGIERESQYFAIANQRIGNAHTEE